jgi:hypothetical protein
MDSCWIELNSEIYPLCGLSVNSYLGIPIYGFTWIKIILLYFIFSKNPFYKKNSIPHNESQFIINKMVPSEKQKVKKPRLMQHTNENYYLVLTQQPAGVFFL